jgi:hypothetical protein
MSERGNQIDVDVDVYGVDILTALFINYVVKKGFKRAVSLSAVRLHFMPPRQVRGQAYYLSIAILSITGSDERIREGESESGERGRL